MMLTRIFGKFLCKFLFFALIIDAMKRAFGFVLRKAFAI